MGSPAATPLTRLLTTAATARAEDVLSAASALFGVSKAELTGNGRWRPLTDHRQVSMSALRELTEASYPFIGRVFNRNHTTVMHACQRVDNDGELREWRRCLVDLAAGASAEAVCWTPRAPEPGEPPALVGAALARAARIAVERMGADSDAPYSSLVNPFLAWAEQAWFQALREAKEGSSASTS